MKLTMGSLLLLAIILQCMPDVAARSAQNYEAKRHSVLESEHSDFSQKQPNAKSDRKQESREKDTGHYITNNQLSLESSSQVQPTCPGVDYALYGYNSLKGCPLAPGRDPGFTLPIFSADYNAGHVSPNCRYSVPRGVLLTPDVSCATSFTSEVIESPYDLAKFMGRTARLDRRGWGPPFVASPVFQKLVAELKQKVLIVSSAACSSYHVSLLHLEPPPLHSVFLKWVLRLNNTSDEDLYLEFLDTYGTHFVSQVRLGASLTLVHEMENSNYNRHAQGHVTSAASYFSAALLGQSETLSPHQKKEADEFQSQVETSTIGIGVPPSTGASSLAWLTAVGNNPVAISYVMTPIDVLFSETFMGDWSPLNRYSVDHVKIKTKLIAIKKEYCQTLKKKGQLSDCEEPTPGLNLSGTRLIGDSLFRDFVSSEQCVEECYKLPDCVAVTFCPDCDSNDSEYKLCQMFQDSNIHSAATNSHWQTTIFLNKIQTLLNLHNLTVITDSTSKSKSFNETSLNSCYTACRDEDLCLAFTAYKSTGTTLKCTRHTGPLLSLKEEISADLYFMSPQSKMTRKTTSPAASLILNDWFRSACVSDNVCHQKNAMCFKDRCRCRPGFFSSTRDNTCSATCTTADLQNTFMEYPESGIMGYNIIVRDELTLEGCKNLCVTTSSCLTLDFKAKGGRCLLHNITSLDVPLTWYPHTSRGWTHYQRTCMDSSESYPGPVWYNSPCRNDLHCPDPNSRCLSGKCSCTVGFFLDQTDVSCRLLESCKDWQKTGAISGAYKVTAADISLKVWCDMDNGGGWLVFQRRRDGSVDFYRNWTDYEHGFGDITGEFWLGLNKIHKLTQGRPHRLRVDLGEVNGESHYAEYSSFSVGGPDTNYTLHVTGYSGDAGDSLRTHNDKAFTTHDQDNDKANSSNCAVTYHGAWWFNSCYGSHLNGRYMYDGALDGNGVEWYQAHLDFRSFTFTEMKFKPV